jgi:error-prone DNA polymerase
LIEELGYESYFLTVHDIVRFARSKGILCQGRGSAANSVVCFVLGITELDPSRFNLLFERFLSKERKEPPDIDVDFEHERREEVMQYVFRRYGRGRAALTAVASTYHGAGAVRDIAKVLGLPPDQVNALAECCGSWSDRAPPIERLLEAGFDPESPVMRRVLALTGELIGFPRHLSQHPGGFVISEAPLDTLVPVENASMAERTVVQWDKDDLDALGLLKVDVLALGMLTTLRRCFGLIERHRGRILTLAGLPEKDAATYEMISRADTVGVFQIESRAQMAMLPRLRPKAFYDLVIQVAIVRPGPIQGDMVHPYLRRRNKEEAEDYPSDELKTVLQRTLGVPLFQEQVMQIAMVAAEYTAEEADGLRRSMAAWKRHGGLEPHRIRLTERMLKKGYELAFIQRLFEQIKGFGSYGFPESHAASFALLAYASSWLKCHEPAIFACALVNSWPMGFYTPDQVLQDARRHGIEVRPVDVRHSDWDCDLEPDARGRLAIRLGLRMVKGFNEEAAGRISAARAIRAFDDVADLCHRARLDARARERLADAGTLRGLAGHRHRARWAVAAVEEELPLFAGLPQQAELPVDLPLPSRGEDLHADYDTLGTTLGPHPLALLRGALARRRCRSSRDLAGTEHGQAVSVAGLVKGRQRPQTASGVVFVTLEDEFGMVNVVVWHDIAVRQRRVLVGSQMLQVDGRLETKDGVRHLIARRLHDLTPLLAGLDVRSRDFH